MKQRVRLREFVRWPAVLLLAVAMGFGASAQHAINQLAQMAGPNLLSNGGFEVVKPAYWDATGAGAVWSMDVSRTPGTSLKLTGSGEAMWKQEEAVLNWVSRIKGNQEIVVGGYVWTDGVNTAPASDAEKFQMVFEFFDAAGGTDLLGGPLVLDLPQSEATTGGWVKIDNTAIAPLVLPQDAQSVKISFRKGANATGTAYLDDVFLYNAGEGDWPGGWFNPNMDAGDTWYYWWDGFDLGREDWPENQPFFQTVTAEEAHSGMYSLKLVQNDPDASEAVAISQRVPVTPGVPVLVSFWVKTKDVAHPDSIGTADYNIGMTALWYENMTAGAEGYGEIGGLDIRLNGEYNEQVIPLVPREEETGWTQYAFVVNPKEGAVGMELRLRYWHHFEGITYWDDVFIGTVPSLQAELPNLLSNGGFEAGKPAYWQASGSGAVWSMDVSRTPGTSLMLTGAGEAVWTQEEAVLNWVSRIKGNQEIVVGGWVWTDGVTTDPTADAGKFQLVFEFFDAAGGTDLLGGPLVLDLPQSEATTGGWVKIDNTSIAPLVLPQDAQSVKISFRKGANATGTAYLDDVFLYNAGEGDWPGGWFNPNMDAGDTWYYWWDGFDLGKDDWPDNQPFFQTVTKEEARSGLYSLKLVQNDPDASEAVAISQRVPVTPGEPVLVSFWVKTKDVAHPDSIGTADYNIGMTALWYENMTAGADGYGEIGGLDIRLNGEYNEQVFPLVPRETNTEWTQYAFVVNPKEGAVGMELRLRYWHHFEGITFWDDVYITSIGSVGLVGTSAEDDGVARELPSRISLHQNYPNPFNPATTIAFDLSASAKVTLDVFDVLGRRVETLLTNEILTAGVHEVRFDASRLPSGTYLYVLRTNERTEARTMVLLK